MTDAKENVERIVAEADALYHDLDFGAVKRFKEAHPEAKVIGCLPTYSPKEIIHAAGMLPVHLRGAGDQVEIIRGDAYFQSYICQLPRGIIELALSGRLASFDGFVFPAICDVIRNLSGIWQLLFPEKLARYLDIPQNFDAAVGGRFYARELRSILDDLERLSGAKVSDDDLRRSIAAYNHNRTSIEALMSLRAERPWLVPADEAYLVLRAGDTLLVEDHTRMVDEYVAAVLELDRPKRDHSRVVMSGAFCEQPPLGLIRTLERAGCYIVWDDMTISSRFIVGDVATEGDPLAALASAFVERAVESASVYACKRQKGSELCRTVRRSRAEGVIFAAPSFCDPALLDQPMLQAALDKEQIPWTAFKYAENLGQFQVIREQAGTFSDSIRLWGQ
ncbi:MAG: benzoyl-CoA reductase subunit C [Polyangiaceae bacterium]|jgi:benzoyl-CoA reductase subunit C|nr:benzoyl-CoA reductase subunit C [Polyangiaceae bacterium]